MKHKIIIELVKTKNDIEVEADNELEHLTKKERATAFYAISHYFKLLVDEITFQDTTENHLKLKEKKNVIN